MDYLEVLAAEVKLVPDLDEGGQRVRQEAEDAVNFLKDRQDFWSQFQPMYSEVKKRFS